MTTLGLDAIQADLNLIFVSDGTSGSNKVARLLNSVPALIAEVKALRGKVAGVEALAKQIAENAEVNWEQDNFDAGQVQAVDQILAALHCETPTTGEPE